MGPDLVVLWIASFLCVAAVLCAMAFAMLRRRRLLRVCGVTVTALSALIVTVVVVGAQPRSGPVAMVAGVPTAKPTSGPKAPTAPPAAAKTDPEVLRNFSASWTDVVRISVAALKAHDSAGEYLRNEDVPAAYRELKNCQDSASSIVGQSFNLRLDPQNGSDRALLIAINKVGDGLESVCKSARSYFETKSPSDFADAKTHFANVVDGIFQAEQLARMKYHRLGGNPDALLSFKTALR